MPKTRVIAVDAEKPDPAVIAEAAGLIREGGLVAFATETVYGLGADATNPEAVARIFEAKGRPATNPLIVHVASQDAAQACVATWPNTANLLAQHFWPGPLTLVLPRSGIIPDIVTAGQDTVGVRVPRPGVARWLIFEAGRPLAAPSANRSMGLSPTQAKHVHKDLDGKVDLILDSGPTTIGIESTVLDLTSDPPRVLRPGKITPERMAEIIGKPVEGHRGGFFAESSARSPGQMAVHYAPRTPAYRLDRDQAPPARIEGSYRAMLVGRAPDSFLVEERRGKPGVKINAYLIEPEDAAHLLYARLHEFDSFGVDFILIIPPPDQPRWRAIRDRIWRATKPWPGQESAVSAPAE